MVNRIELGNKVEEVMKNLDLEGQCCVLNKALEMLYDTLRQEGFGCFITVSGDLSDGTVSVCCTDAGDVTNWQTSYARSVRI